MPSEASLANLKPAWQPGKSGNERGLNRQYQAMLRHGRINSLDMMQVAVQCAKDPDAPWPARLTAVALVLDRSWGKPKEHINLTGDGIHTLRVEFVDPRDNTDRAKGNGTARTINGESFEITFDGPKEEDAP